MKMSVSPYLRFISSSRFRICAWTDTSSAETGSSQMISFGSVATARAIEMRWHWPPENSCGRLGPATAGSIPTVSSTSLTRAARDALSPSFQMSRPSRTMSRTLPAWVQRRDRVLEDHLELRPQRAEELAPEVGEVVALERDRSALRRDELHHGLAHGRLAATGLAHEAERLAGEHVDADVGHGVDLEPGAPDRELDDEVLDAQQRLVGGAEVGGAAAGHQTAAMATADSTPACTLASSAARLSGVPTGIQHRNACPWSTASVSGGSCSTHFGCT